MSKEPGQLAYEAWMRARYSEPDLQWDAEPRMSQQRHAAVESAIRADERAKVRAETIEECAELVDFPSDATATTEPSDYVKGRRDAATAIRAKIGVEHG